MQPSMNIITGISGVFAKKCLQAHAIWQDIVLSVMQNKHGCVCMCAYMCSIAYLYIGDPYIHYSLVSVHSHILTTTIVAVGIHALPNTTVMSCHFSVCICTLLGVCILCVATLLHHPCSGQKGGRRTE